MPNGGYPRHLLTPLGDSEIQILTTGWNITVRRRHEEGLYEFGGLNEIQTSALLYHLLYWMGFKTSNSWRQFGKAWSAQASHSIRTSTRTDALTTTNQNDGGGDFIVE